MNDIENWIGGIHCGNAIDELRKIPSESVNAVITDPPYNISKGNTNLQHYEHDDIIQEFGDWDKNEILPHEWVGECQRIFEEKRSFYFFL